MAFVRIVLIFLCLFVQSISLVEIGCDKISGTRQGRKYCFIRNTVGAQYTRVTFKEDDYAADRQELVFDNCTFHSLPEGMFEFYPNLHTMYTWNTGIRNVSWEAFKNSQHLKSLDLSQNNITELQDNGAGTFSLSPNLIRLDVSNNEIRAIVKTAFMGLSRLTHLYLENNRIEAIFPETFDPLVKLTTLRLNKNQITRIESKLFHNNRELSILHVNDNKIEFLDGEYGFRHLRSMQVFDCHNNPIRGLMHVAVNAANIDIRNTGAMGCFIGNRTKSIVASDNNISYVIVAHGAKDLQHLDLSNNKLPTMANLTHFEQLITLDLSGNKISDIGINSFSNMHKLESLKLQNCGIGSIHYGLLSHKSKLKELDISYNHLGTIDFNMFMSMASLKALYLEGNNLTDIDMSAIRKIFPALSKIGISQNSWWCENLALVIKFLESEGIELNSVGLIRNTENIKGIPCSPVVAERPVPMPRTAERIQTQQVIVVEEIRNEEIQKLRDSCRFSLTNPNDMELIIKLIELKYETIAISEAVRLISDRIETILDSLQNIQMRR